MLELHALYFPAQRPCLLSQHCPSFCRLDGDLHFMDSRAVQLGHAKQRERGLAVELAKDAVRRGEHSVREYEEQAKHWGCWGVNPFTYLHYLNLQYLFLVPVAHSLLYGIVRTFVDWLLCEPYPKAGARGAQWVLGTQQRSLIRERAGHLRVTSDFRRPYRCVMRYR